MASKWREVFQKASLDTRAADDGKKKGKAGMIAVQRPAALPRSAKAKSPAEPSASASSSAAPAPGKKAAAAGGKTAPVKGGRATSSGARAGLRTDAVARVESAAEPVASSAAAAATSQPADAAAKAQSPSKGAGRAETAKIETAKIEALSRSTGRADKATPEAVVVAEGASADPASKIDAPARRKKGLARKASGSVAEAEEGARAQAFTERVKQVLGRPPQKASTRSAAARAAAEAKAPAAPAPTAMVTVVADSADLDRQAARRPTAPTSPARPVAHGDTAPAGSSAPEASLQARATADAVAAAPAIGGSGDADPASEGGERRNSRLALIKAAAARAERPPTAPTRNTPRPELMAPSGNTPRPEVPRLPAVSEAAEVIASPASAPRARSRKTPRPEITARSGGQEMVPPTGQPAHADPVADVASQAGEAPRSDGASRSSAAPASELPVPSPVAAELEVTMASSEAAPAPARAPILPSIASAAKAWLAEIRAGRSSTPAPVLESKAPEGVADGAPPALAADAASPSLAEETLAPAAEAIPAPAADVTPRFADAAAEARAVAAAVARVAEVAASLAGAPSAAAALDEGAASPALDPASPAPVRSEVPAAPSADERASAESSARQPEMSRESSGALAEEASPWAVDWGPGSASRELDPVLLAPVEETAVDRSQPVEPPWTSAGGSAADLRVPVLPEAMAGLEPAGAQALSAVDVALSAATEVRVAPPVPFEALLRRDPASDDRGPQQFAAGAVAAVTAVLEPGSALAPRSAPPAIPEAALPPAAPRPALKRPTGSIEIEALPPAWENETTTEIELPEGDGQVNDLVLAVIPDGPAPAKTEAAPRRSRSPVSWLFGKLRALVARR
jgi:hypothetical protein